MPTYAAQRVFMESGTGDRDYSHLIFVVQEKILRFGTVYGSIVSRDTSRSKPCSTGFRLHKGGDRDLWTREHGACKKPDAEMDPESLIDL